jgi:hypothetical protein
VSQISSYTRQLAAQSVTESDHRTPPFIGKLHSSNPRKPFLGSAPHAASPLEESAGSCTAGPVAYVFAPAAAAFVIALYDWKPLSGQAKFVGLANVLAVLTDPEPGTAFRQHPPPYTLVVVPGSMAVGLFIALALRAVHRGAGLYKALYSPTRVGGCPWKQKDSP